MQEIDQQLNRFALQRRVPRVSRFRWRNIALLAEVPKDRELRPVGIESPASRRAARRPPPALDPATTLHAVRLSAVSRIPKEWRRAGRAAADLPGVPPVSPDSLTVYDFCAELGWRAHAQG